MNREVATPGDGLWPAPPPQEESATMRPNQSPAIQKTGKPRFIGKISVLTSRPWHVSYSASRFTRGAFATSFMGG
jgi:hypothetical protein